MYHYDVEPLKWAKTCVKSLYIIISFNVYNVILGRNFHSVFLHIGIFEKVENNIKHIKAKRIKFGK